MRMGHDGKPYLALIVVACDRSQHVGGLLPLFCHPQKSGKWRGGGADMLFGAELRTTKSKRLEGGGCVYGASGRREREE